MTDTALLREKIQKSGYKIKFIAETVGLSYFGFLRKMQNDSDFRTGEVDSLCRLLHIDSLEEKERIFFAQKDDLKSSSKEEIV